ncbi:MAG TPA: methyltransferase domain-containing protein [Polyangia bacterium]|nr:methyltransferase domain-containing protein [Polyangia bacterium]
MRPRALALLACPDCGGDLEVATGRVGADGHIETGSLRCRGCGARYPIEHGVPRLLHGAVASEALATSARFGAEWQTFDHLGSYDERWLRGWLDPIGPADFRDRVVFEGGCGKGRHTVIAARWGAREIVALDLGAAAQVAFAHTRALPNVHVVQGDLVHPPVRRAFDLAFSIGVLHHLPRPQAGFEALCGRVKPGGRVAIWVYGRESNEWIVRFVNPVRERVTSRLPTRLLYWLSLPPSLVLSAAARLSRRSQRLGARLPYRDYLPMLASVPLREVHSIVFDQLVTPIAYYLPEAEVRSWFARDGLRDVQIAWHNRNSWRACARVAGE